MEFHAFLLLLSSMNMNSMLWKKPQNQNVIFLHEEYNMNELTTTNQGGPVVLDEELMGLEGMGSENVRAKDILIPRLTILQGLSPQINKKKAEYIEGAEVGDFCNVATGDIYKEEVTVIPVYFQTAYIEWIKNRGGIAANHGDDPSILEKCTRSEKNEMFLPNGNNIQENAQWYCLLQDGATWHQ